MTLDYYQIDAFSNKGLYGNPAAVVFEADAISADTMQKIARETNLSETVFILKPTVPDADYRARIFSPLSELPFAGHPTIAAAFGLLHRYPELAVKKLLRQECGIGVVPIEVIAEESGNLFRITQGEPTYRDSGLSRDTIAKMLGCKEDDLADRPFEVISTGLPWLIVELSNFSAISALQPDLGFMATQTTKIKSAGVTVLAEKDNGASVRFRIRTFAPAEGISEDPVCGSGNGAVAAYVARHKNPTDPKGEYRAEQGIEIGRDGAIQSSWERDGEQLRIRVGGHAALFSEGKIHL